MNFRLSATSSAGVLFKVQESGVGGWSLGKGLWGFGCGVQGSVFEVEGWEFTGRCGHAPLVIFLPPPQRGNNTKDPQDFFLQAKARICPWLSCMCHIRVGVGVSPQRMHKFNVFSKSTLPQDRQLTVHYY